MEHLNTTLKMPLRAAEFQLSRRLAKALLLVLVIATPCATSAAAQDTVTHKQVFILFSSDSSSASQIIVERAMRSTLKDGSPVPVEIYAEYLDAQRTGVGVYEEELVSLLRRKYADKEFDLIFTITEPGLQIMLRNGPDLFPNTPVVFLAIDQSMIAGLNLGPNVTGVWGEINFKPNLELALALHPGTERVVVIGGLTAWDRYWTARLQETCRAYESSLEFTYLIGLTSAELRDALAGLPPHTVVIFVTNVMDKAGNTYENKELLSEICPGSSAPIFGSTDTQLGHGIVGGRLLGFEALGVGGAQVGLRILAGEKPEAIPPHGIPSVAMFDWRQLKRWGISEESLPPESLVRFRVPSFWDQYKWYVIAVFSVLMIQSGLITGLVIHRARRKRAEQALSQSEQRNRDIVRAQPDLLFVNAPDGVFIDYHAHDKSDLLVPPEEFLGRNLPDVLPSDLAEAYLDCFRRAKRSGELQVLEYEVPKFGEMRWYEARVIYTDADQFITIVRDVTKRRQALEALRESEARFRNMADSAPVMIWVSDTHNLCTYVNKQWLDFTGRSLEEELGDTWTAGIHPEDLDRSLQTYKSASESREPFTMEYRLRRKDGQFRWLLDSGAPRLSPNGRFLGYIGCCVDITERKVAEETLEDLSGQLIQAREDERARIARDLHDDLNQRVAMISIKLDRLLQSPRESQAKLCEVVNEVLTHTAGLSEEIHRMSHDLHPSKLEHLGLVAALKSLCVELSQNYGLRIEFRHSGGSSLSKDVSICLYRIAQESLNNVIKHSGAKEAVVELRASDQEIQLRVWDLGRGFDTESPRIKKGLGLVSMRERLRVVGGQITINSRPSHGTQVEARIPIESKPALLRYVQQEAAPDVSNHREMQRRKEASQR